MSSPVFISYSSVDQSVAETICSALESRGLNCWIASRDIAAGRNFQESIVQAIRSAKVMLLIFTSNANNSNEIKKELVLAGQHRVTVVPVRVEDVIPSDAFAYEFATRQWVDLFKDWETEIERLASQLNGIVAEAPAPGEARTGPVSVPRVPLKPPGRAASSRSFTGLAALAILALAAVGAYLYLRPQAPTTATSQAPQLNADDTAWLDATNTGTVPALRKYLERFPAGAHVADAQQRVRLADESAWAADATPGTIVSFNQYLDQFPDGMHAAQARGAIADLGRKAADESAWLDALNAGTVDALNAYLKAFPAGAHAAQAQQRIADLSGSTTPLSTTPTVAIATNPSATDISTAKYDGRWTTVVNCAQVQTAGAFNILVEADIKGGTYHGDKGTKGQPGWFTLDGKVKSDGTLDLYARGVVPSSRLALGNVGVGTDYGYQVTGRLDGAKGTGARVGGRPCSVIFTKQ